MLMMIVLLCDLESIRCTRLDEYFMTPVRNDSPCIIIIQLMQELEVYSC